MGIFARFDDFIDGGVHADIADVVGDGVGEEMSVLCHHGNRSAQRFQGDIFDVDAIVGDLSAVERIEPRKQGDDGCLASTGGADKGNFLARVDFKGDIVKNLFSFHIGERDMRKDDVPVKRDSVTCFFAAKHITLGKLFGSFIDKLKFVFSLIVLFFFVQEGENSLRTC